MTYPSIFTAAAKRVFAGEGFVKKSGGFYLYLPDEQVVQFFNAEVIQRRDIQFTVALGCFADELTLTQPWQGLTGFDLQALLPPGIRPSFCADDISAPFSFEEYEEKITAILEAFEAHVYPLLKNARSTAGCHELIRRAHNGWPPPDERLVWRCIALGECDCATQYAKRLRTRFAARAYLDECAQSAARMEWILDCLQRGDLAPLKAELENRVARSRAECDSFFRRKKPDITK